MKTKGKSRVKLVRVAPNGRSLAKENAKTESNNLAIRKRQIELLEAEEDAEDLEDIRAAEEAIKREGTVSWEQVKTDLNLW